MAVLNIIARAAGPIGGIIYVTTNLVNGKCYTGFTTKNNPHYVGSGPLLHKAIRKHGRDNFVRRDIVTFATIEEGCALEQFWIRELNSKVPNGYNLSDGGEGTSGCHPSDETRRLMCEHNAMKNRPEVRARVSAAKRGKPMHPASKAALHKANLGNTYRKGMPQSEVQRVVLLGNTYGKANKGKHPSSEARANLSVARRGNTNARGKGKCQRRRAALAAIAQMLLEIIQTREELL